MANCFSSGLVGVGKFQLIPIYNSTILADNPMAYWKLSEANGTVMNDSSGNGHHGTYVGGPTINQDGLIEDDYFSLDRSAIFNGTARGAVIYGAWMNEAVITVEAIIKPLTIGAGARVIVERDTNGSAGTPGRIWNLLLSSGKLSFTVYVSQTKSVSVSLPTAFVAGITHHVVGTYDGAVVNLYVDGAIAASAPLVGALTTLASQGIVLGNGNSGTLPLGGALEKVALYPKALTAAQIANHWAATVPGGINTAPSAPAMNAVGGTAAAAGTFFIAPR